MTLFVLIIISFLMGSIPFGVLFARSKGVNLKEVGSGNIGATNVLRSVGKGAAILTLLGDILKGTAAVAIGRIFGVGPLYEGVLGLAAIMGHDFSPFQGFRGGKGVATSLGVMLLYAPFAGLITVTIWLLTVFLTRVSSLGAIVSFALLPPNVILLGYQREKAVVAAFMAGLLVLKHTGNIKRLLSGTESKVGGKRRVGERG